MLRGHLALSRASSLLDLSESIDTNYPATSFLSSPSLFQILPKNKHKVSILMKLDAFGEMPGKVVKRLQGNGIRSGVAILKFDLAIFVVLFSGS